MKCLVLTGIYIKSLCINVTSKCVCPTVTFILIPYKDGCSEHLISRFQFSSLYFNTWTKRGTLLEVLFIKILENTIQLLLRKIFSCEYVPMETNTSRGIYPRFTLQVTFNISFKYVMTKLSQCAWSSRLAHGTELCQINFYVVYLTLLSVTQNTHGRIVEWLVNNKLWTIWFGHGSPLWSSGHSSCLHIQRSRVRFLTRTPTP
jgi:hypothetical protein